MYSSPPGVFDARHRAIVTFPEPAAEQFYTPSLLPISIRPDRRRYSVFMLPANDTDPDDPFLAARAILANALARHAFPGCAWGVLQGGRVLALEAEGRFTYEPDSPLVTPATLFDLASVTKILATTAAAMLLYDRGRLDLDARLGDILPGFVVGMAPGSGKERVTLRMLLAHASGLPGYVPLYRSASSADALLRAALQLPLEVQPGTRTEYSDIGFILLGKAIEVLAGQPLDALCAGEIFAPLGLRTARFRPPEDMRASIPPTENDTRFRGRILQGEVQDENCFVLNGVSGHAGVFSNVEDLLLFGQTILERGRTGTGKQFFRPQTVDLFTTRQPYESARALGWDVPTPPSSSGRHFGSRSIGHLGYAGTSLWVDPDRQLAVALLTNRTWPDRASELIREIRPAFHDAVVEALR